MNKVAACIAISALAATGAGAQENRRSRVAPPAVYDVAPGLGHFTDDVLFGDVWLRDNLSPRDRSLITVATLISTGKTAQIRGHTGRALDNGVTPVELGEIITHLAFYSGWPNAISAVTEVKRVFDERGIGPVTDSDAPRIQLDAAAESARAATLDAFVATVSPALVELTNRVLFGDLWRRPELSPRDRSLITMATLIAIGQPEQIPFHANRAMDNGLTRREAAEIPVHLGFYAGWPRAMSAVRVLERVFAAREGALQPSSPSSGNSNLKIIRAAPENASAGASDRFTGEVRISSLFRGEEPARIGGGIVAFTVGARTAWHAHPLGQTLFIISGRGWAQKEGGPVEAVGPGDIVWIPPNTRHWHGASAGQAMAHFAVAEALDGTSVTWMEHVSDRDYNAGSR